MPMMKPIIFAAVFLRVDAIRTFDVIYVLTAGGPGTTTTTLSIYIYKTAFESGNFGLAAAGSTVIMIALIPWCRSSSSASPERRRADEHHHDIHAKVRDPPPYDDPRSREAVGGDRRGRGHRTPGEHPLAQRDPGQPEVRG